MLADMSEAMDRGGEFAFSQSGTFVYLSGKVDSQAIFWLDQIADDSSLCPRWTHTCPTGQGAG